MRATKSTHVKTIMLDSGEVIEIRRLEGGALVGLDGSYLSQLADDEEHPNNPYDAGVIIVPETEDPSGEQLSELPAWWPRGKKRHDGI